jgi:hypothetical protein
MAVILKVLNAKLQAATVDWNWIALMIGRMHIVDITRSVLIHFKEHTLGIQHNTVTPWKKCVYTPFIQNQTSFDKLSICSLVVPEASKLETNK